MPGFDGTGPAGMGPVTGWGQGYCNSPQNAYGPGPVSGPRYWGPGYGQGFGRGCGFGRDFRSSFGSGQSYGRGFGRRGAYPAGGRWYGPAYNASYGNPYTMNPEDEVNMLKSEADAVRSELDAINKRIEELRSESSES